MTGEEVARGLGDSAEPPEGDEADDYATALDDIAAGLGVEVKDRAKLQAGLEALCMKCCAEMEHPSAPKGGAGLTVVLGGRGK